MELELNAKNAASALLAVIGGATAITGAIRGDVGLINIGLAGLFLGAVVFTFKSPGYVHREGFEAVMKSYRKLLLKMVEDLGLEGKAVYIPPYENLPEGGTFIPLREDFEPSLGKLDSETVFLTNVSNEREMGLSIRPTGLELVREFEDFFEGPLNGTGAEVVESVAGSVLRALNLAKTVYIEEVDDGFRVVVRPAFQCSPEGCDQVACPVCSSIMLSLARATGRLIVTESIERKEYGIEVRARTLGGVEEWM
ncbi:hypothetical protein [Thermococcus aciditolerans]|uniref:DUF7982 domain-containing protein n=1 Tax=Thermococcus aciditolerans TaxID=2598455 RepID=A0A5C0SKU8_9EURY|nr:hypothetical protein [Thermococcus aciditolerans]QEK14993.1 hypothetical protein FPV09_07710 [Thermococcus aciditolerans]